MSFEMEQLVFQPTNRPLVDQVNGNIASGEITAVIGPNGSGKSTLLKLLSGLEKLSSGSLKILGTPAEKWSRKALARKLAMLPQSSPVPMGISVRELVGSGRFPWIGNFGRMTKQDYQAVDEALERTDLAHLQNREINRLSGGERQRAWLAVALAQQTEILLLDEPTSWLDISHQLRLVEIVQTLNQQKNTTIVWVLHDLNQAAWYSDKLMVMQQGKMIAQGAPKQIMTAELLKNVFGVSASKALPVEGFLDHSATDYWIPQLTSQQLKREAS